MSRVIAFDTSNYTTSVAVFDGEQGENAGRLLDVPQGALGLRQSDALFSHVKRLPELTARLRQLGLLDGIAAVGASATPREVEGSYMPCFLAGVSQAKVLADVLGVPYYFCSHQQGHLAAAAWSSGHLELLDAPFLAWHLSGGTTELLKVQPEGVNVRAAAIGGTSDISAGQLIDRTGQVLGLNFPAGKELDRLSQTADKELSFPVKVKDMTFSLSGMENKVLQLAEQGERPENIAAFSLRCVAYAVERATRQAMEKYPGLPVLCSGGVASNGLLRQVMSQRCGAVFAPPQYSTDNAMGTAILTYRQWKEEQG